MIIRLLSVLSFMLVVAGCGQSAQVNKNVREVEREAQQAVSSIAPETQSRRALRVDPRPWYGDKAVPVKGGNSLPPELTQRDSLVMTFAGPTSLFDTMEMVESVTGLPVILSNNIYGESMGNLAARQFLPSDGEEVAGGRIVWSGSLDRLLDQIANTYGAEWGYDGNAISFSTEVTRTFMLNALSSTLTLNSNATNGGGDSTANIPDLGVDGTTTIEIWQEVTETVESILGDQGQASFSPSTGSITVTARPDVAKRVENYLRQQNETRLRRVAVSVKVLSVQTADGRTIGTDISGVIKGALGGTSIDGTANATDGLNLSVTRTPRTTSGDVASTLLASEAIDRVSIVHSGSLVTLSDQPAPLQVSRQIAFLERVSSSGDDAGSVSLEPGTIDVGLFMTVLPRIVPDDKILMRLAIAITDADPNFRTFGTDAIQIELPEIDTTGFLQNAVVSNGETIVLAGFEKTQNSLDDNGVPGLGLLGGTSTTSRARELTVLVINAQILPEEPFTVIGS